MRDEFTMTLSVLAGLVCVSVRSPRSANTRPDALIGTTPPFLRD